MARDEIISQVRLHIESAAALLRSLGAEYERAAWLVEDSVQFIQDESALDAERAEVPWQKFSYEDCPAEEQPRKAG